MGLLGAKRRSRAYLVAAVALLFAGVPIGAYYWQSQEAGAGDATPFFDAVSILESDPGEPAALVNGVPIPMAKLQAYVVMSTGVGVRPGQAETPPFTEDEYVRLLIDNELLFQEAVRQGFMPSDSEVRSLAETMKRSILDTMAQDSPEADDLRKLFAQVEGTAYHVEVYDSSEVMLDAFRRQIAISRLTGQVIARLPEQDRSDPAKREQAISEFVAGLRTSAASTS